ncbi:transcription factor TFIID complex subunit 8 C-term-domain-containing protein [Phyllosticta capitalensis]|uniref:Transcription initiation factor TFIID subunit 8 n=1 Tax=Phyllosticta capitalensis TaxID=121624 RepID=A0ABR1YZE0_9PEZI
MMPGLRYPEASQHNYAAGIKRSASDFDAHDSQIAKRRRIVHHIKHKQPWEVDPTLTPQDEKVFGSQMLRAISLTLGAVGFDGAMPSALEMFRGQIEEFMLHFLADVRASMQLARRTTPLPGDFALALAHTGYTSSDLEPQLHLQIPPEVTQPPLPPPPRAESPPPKLEELLGKELSGVSEKATRPWIPGHLPAFPSRHTWQSTPQYPNRETDPWKIRERAAQEGILAEQALRKLMAAGRGGAAKRPRITANSDAAKEKSAIPQASEVWEEAMKEVMQEEAAKSKFSRGFEMDSLDPFNTEMNASGRVKEDEKNAVVDAGLLVNYDQKYWRKGAQAGAWR